MKRPLSRGAFDAYVANPQCAAYLASDILEKRLHQLLRLIADGENSRSARLRTLCFSRAKYSDSYGPKYSPPRTRRRFKQ
jgi:hypothetical protein